MGGNWGHPFEPQPSEVSNPFPLSFALVLRFTSPDMGKSLGGASL